MKNILLLSIAFLIIHQGFSQESEKEILDRFFEIYKTNSTEAIEYLYGFNDWIDGEGDAIKQLKSQLKQYEELVGSYVGEEFIYKNKIGDTYVIYIYLAKYERQPFRFTIDFYKPKDKWMVYGFKFDDNFDDDMEEAIKYEYLIGK